MNNNDALIQHAVELLRECPEYVEDAKVGAPRGNSVVGSVMSLTLGAPRQNAEAAVRRALAIMSESE